MSRVMADKQNGSPFLRDTFHLSEAAFLKSRITHRKDLVNNQDFRFQVSCHRESQTHIHAAGVALDRCVDEFFELRESDYLIELFVDLAFPHAQDGAVEVSVLATRELCVKSGAHFKQRPDPPVNLRSPG